jgi:hypothetical protein
MREPDHEIGAEDQGPEHVDAAQHERRPGVARPATSASRIETSPALRTILAATRKIPAVGGQEGGQRRAPSGQPRPTRITRTTAAPHRILTGTNRDELKKKSLIAVRITPVRRGAAGNPAISALDTTGGDALHEVALEEHVQDQIGTVAMTTVAMRGGQLFASPPARRNWLRAIGSVLVRHLRRI